MTTHAGSCHCGRIAFTLEGDIGQVIDCNCSMCRRRGGLLAFFPRSAMTLSTPERDIATYTFNKHVIHHQFCPTCGCAPFGFGQGPGGQEMAAINLRCLEDVDLGAIKRKPVDGRSL